MTIYLPDDLGGRVKRHPDLNVSGICQRALRAALDVENRPSLLDEGKGMKRVVVRDETRGGSDVAFTGELIHYHEERGHEVFFYRTRQGRLAVYDRDAEALYDFDDFEDLATAPGWSEDEGGDPELLAAVAAALGESYVIELDI